MEDKRRNIPLVFSGSALRVHAENLHLPRILITFSHWNKRRPISPGLAQAAGMGFAGVVASQNHWWQTDEFPAALEAIGSLVSPTAKIVSFGSSMGGAGALLSAQFMKVDTVLAVAPPIIVDHSVAPWEKRFRNVQHLTKCRFHLSANASPTTRTFIVYDPFYEDDVNHLQLMKHSGRQFTRWPLPHSNHGPLLELSKSGLYRDFTTAFFINEDFESAWSILRSARHKRGMPDLVRAQRKTFATNRYHNADYVEFLTMLLERHGPQIELLEERGLSHMKQGAPRKALADFESCVELENRKRYTRHVEATLAKLA